MPPDASICQCLTPPEVEPVSLAEAKAHLRVDGDDENALISGCIATARQTFEQETRRSFLSQQWVAYITGCVGRIASIELPRSRVLEGEGNAAVVEYRKTDGTWATLATPGDWYLQAVREPALLWITASPSDIDSPRSPDDAVWRVTYWSGYGVEPTSVPGPIRHAIMLMTAHLFERREIVISGATITEVPVSIDRLLNPYRIPWGGGI